MVLDCAEDCHLKDQARGETSEPRNRGAFPPYYPC